jgi:hypothetical protein
MHHYIKYIQLIVKKLAKEIFLTEFDYVQLIRGQTQVNDPAHEALPANPLSPLNSITAGDNASLKPVILQRDGKEWMSSSILFNIVQYCSMLFNVVQGCSIQDCCPQVSLVPQVPLKVITKKTVKNFYILPFIGLILKLFYIENIVKKR